MKTLPTGQVIMPTTKNIVVGSGCVEQSLLATLEQMGVSRVFLVSTPSLKRNGLTDKVKAILGDKCVSEYCESIAHTPESIVEKAVDSVKAAKPDVLISLGGSSVVDLGKAIALVLAEGNDYQSMKISFSPETGPVLVPLLAPKMPHISIPTTLSAAEFTFAVAITDEAKGEKNLYADGKLTPAVVFQDPSLCEPTPALLWGSSGMKIFSDCVEMLCSPRAMPVTNALANEALELLYNNLKESLNPEAHQARANCMLAGFMVMSFALNAGIGMVAALRHQLGGNQNVSHGEASSIVLPHVLRWNMPSIKTQLAVMAVKLGVADRGADDDSAATAMVEAIEQLTADMGIPSTLTAVNVDKAALRPIAEHAASDIAMAMNPRPSTADEILTVLEAAY